MEITLIKDIKASPYIRKKDMVEHFGIASSTLNIRINELEQEVKQGRYSAYSIIKDGGVILVNYLVFIDYMKYRSRLKEKNLRKNVPAYEPKAVAKEIGWYAS